MIKLNLAGTLDLGQTDVPLVEFEVVRRYSGLIPCHNTLRGKMVKCG